MDENSGTSKKLPAANVVAVVPPGASAGRPAANAKRRSIRAETAENEPMKVIEGGARKRPPDVKDHIGQQLRAVYDDILKQPIPARFMDLLQELASKSTNDGK